MLKVDIESNYDERRKGKIIIASEGGQTYEMLVIQSTKPSQVSVSKTLVELPSKNAGKSSIDVQGAANSEWTISSDANWIRIEGPATRTGSGQVTIRTLPNSTGAPRSAFLSVGSQRVTVVQGVEDLTAESEPAKPGAPKPAVTRPATRPSVAAPVKKAN